MTTGHALGALGFLTFSVTLRLVLRAKREHQLRAARTSLAATFIRPPKSESYAGTGTWVPPTTTWAAPPRN